MIAENGVTFKEKQKKTDYPGKRYTNKGEKCYNKTVLA